MSSSLSNLVFPQGVPCGPLGRTGHMIPAARRQMVSSAFDSNLVAFSETLLAAQAALAYWSVVSPFSPYGPTIALVVILLVAAIKALIEDAARHREDVKINHGKTRILHRDGKAFTRPS